MLDNLRRKSLLHSYNNPEHQIRFEQGHAIYKNLFSIGYHSTRYSKVGALKSFSSTFDSVGKGFWIVFDMLDSVEFNMIACPSGTFIMGHSDRADNRPRKETIERSFLLGEAEVTESLFNMDNHNSNCPQANVSWFDAILFCNILSKSKGLEECYEVSDITKGKDEYGDIVIKSANVSWNKSANGFRLPTEKEWEYAAKAGTENKWAGTNTDGNLFDYACFGGDSNYTAPHNVKTKLPNEWGFYDMSGNVSEWCWDMYNPNDTNPNSANRVYRSGSFDARLASSFGNSVRGSCEPSVHEYDKGFRLCRTIFSKV